MTHAGRVISDRYELLAPLGEGGMGVVWRARDGRLGRTVAVKLLAAAALGSDLARKRLVREAHAAAALEHPGIVRVYDVGETDDGGAFLVMELIRGRSLRSEMAAEPIGLARVAAVTVQAARALHFAHQAGIIHRDVKPDNIMIRDTGVVVVVDFGVAKPIATALAANADTAPGALETSLTAEGQLVGTPAYLSPEQARGQEVTAATDQFALAVTAYQAITGALPWKGSGVLDIVASILRDEPPPLADHLPAALASLDRVLRRALSKAPEDRWPDLAAFAGALEAAATDLPAGAAASRPGVTAGDIAASTIVVPLTPHRAALRPLLGVAALAVGIAGLWLSLRTGTPTASPAPSSSSSAAPSPTPTARVACPPFVVSGVDEPWLGAAAATLACERLAMVHGGLDAATLGPAELAGIPRELSDVPVPYETADGREPAVRAAAAAGTWLDGSLERRPSGYMVHIAVRAPDGAELSHGEGQGAELFEAIRAALQPQLGAPDERESALLRQWLDVPSAEAALALLDMRTAVLIEDPVSLREACQALAARTDLEPRVHYFARWTCARRLRTGKLADAPPPIDEATPAALITTTLVQGTAGGPDAVRQRAARLEAERDRVSSIEGKARLSAAAAEVYNSIGDERGRLAARAAVQISPKAVDWRTSAWHRLAFSSEIEGTIVNALGAWQGWEPISQSSRAPRGQPGGSEQLLLFTRRTYFLGQRGFYAYEYASELLARGRLEEARGIADLAHDPLLDLDIRIAEAKYGLVLGRVPELLAAMTASDETASAAFRIANDGVRASTTLERPADFVDALVTRWVEAEPHHVVDGVVPFCALVAVCCQAPRPVGKRCIERLQHLRTEAKLPTIFNGADVLVAGAARYVEGDYRGAAKAWRTILRTPGWIQDAMHDPMAVAFDRGGMPELGSEIDGITVAFVDLPRTAELAWVREARRAEARGDTATARKLATAVIDKWRFADEDVPAMQEMKALLARLPKH